MTGAWARWLERTGQGLSRVGGDERAQAGIGREDTVIPVTVSARWRDEHGEAVQELEGGQLEHVLSVGTGLWQMAAQALALAHPRQAFAGEHRPGAITQQPFESRAVLGLDPNAGIEREP